MRGLAGSGAAKVRHLFGLCKAFEGKVWKWRWFLTDVGCWRYKMRHLQTKTSELQSKHKYSLVLHSENKTTSDYDKIREIDACVTYCQGIFPPSSTISFRLASRTSGILVRDKKWQPFPIVSYLIDFHSSTKSVNVKLLNVKSMLSAHRTKSPT